MATQIDFHDLPPEVVAMAKYCILDTIGVALAGADTPVVRIVREFALEGACQGKASVWASRKKTRAAQNGLTAAGMANMGLTAAANLLDSEGSFFTLTTDGGAKDALTKIGSPYEMTEPGVAFKRFPSCSATHAAVDAVIELATAYDLKPEEIQRIRCEVTPQVDYCLVYDEPGIPDEARFSMPACVAQAIRYRDLNLLFKSRF